jgi:hypothetical protein
MKKFAFSLFLFLLSLSATCQDNTASMFVDGRSWRYEHLKPYYQVPNDEPDGYTSYNYVLKVDGETVFDGHPCKRITCSNTDGTTLYAYGYEENGRVMFYSLFNAPAFYAAFPIEQWVTLYEFTVSKGSNCHMDAFCCNDMIVKEEGTVDNDGTVRRYIGLGDAKVPTWPVSYAVEGIGSSFGLFEFTNLITDGSTSRFLGCYDDETCLFSADDFKSLTTDISSIQTAKRFLPSGMYNLQGQRLSEKPKHGVFIRGGRKFFVK